MGLPLACASRGVVAQQIYAIPLHANSKADDVEGNWPSVLQIFSGIEVHDLPQHGRYAGEKCLGGENELVEQQAHGRHEMLTLKFWNLANRASPLSYCAATKRVHHQGQSATRQHTYLSVPLLELGECPPLAILQARKGKSQGPTATEGSAEI